MKKNIVIVVSIIAIVIGGTVGKTFVKAFLDNKKAESTYQKLEQASKRMNATLPRKLDKGTRLDSTEAGTDNSMTLYLTLADISVEDTDPEAFRDKMRPYLTQRYKTSSDLAAFREAQVEVRFTYRDKAGKEFATIAVGPNTF